MNSYTQKTHFETCLGYLPKSPLDLSFKEESEVNGYDDAEREKIFIQRIQLVHKIVQENLEKS